MFEEHNSLQYPSALFTILLYHSIIFLFLFFKIICCLPEKLSLNVFSFFFIVTISHVTFALFSLSFSCLCRLLTTSFFTNPFRLICLKLPGLNLTILLLSTDSSGQNKLRNSKEMLCKPFGGNLPTT